ncbi:helix-turn-helix domain-containing protein [Clostridium oryzae]|uniref:Helix-turn-helix domain protein n=1 Tax=Clostridium oryzae TaxID=1450648 RepID=A0A1V4IMA8_9CLOT|nr:helix-turn-helix transcriptional regulator [Clostridium oryzae]OPJ61162.1 helix-turn-helix domain protein [Clostridium oryzae]
MKNINSFYAYEIPNVNLAATGKRLKQLRRNANISVEQLQKIFGFNNLTTIYKWESGRCLPDINNMFVLTSLYEVSLESIYVLGKEDKMLSRLYMLN